MTTVRYFQQELERRKNMPPQITSASRIIQAPAKIIYNILADYRKEHPQILPKEYFQSLKVEEGGVGAGTIISFEMRLLGQTQSFRSNITEPDPGRLLVETDIKSGTKTSFRLDPLEDDSKTLLTINTELKGINALQGMIVKALLQKVYRQELNLIAERAEMLAKSSPDNPQNHSSQVG